MNRRDFIKHAALTGTSSLLLARASAASSIATEPGSTQAQTLLASGALNIRELPNLSPARWIWYPSSRTLPNTFILFRKTLRLNSPIRQATGWIMADSRYRLDVNGRRIQWGPAPSDPRWPEADPMDLTQFLQPGENVFAATVLYYGHGDGTHPLGKPGFLFRLLIEYTDGTSEVVASDDSWKCLLSRAWKPGQYKRWYLRALQEEFDARLHPHDWTQPNTTLEKGWLAAMPLNASPNLPSITSSYPDSLLDISSAPASSQLRPRSIPLLLETSVAPERLTESHKLLWSIPPRDYFDMRIPDAFTVVQEACATETEDKIYEIPASPNHGSVLTFEFKEQMVGWPFFSIDAPAGTTIELLVHEAHAPGAHGLANSHFDSWSRFICKEGINHFETFDFESLRWLQLHIHPTSQPVRIAQIGVRRRRFPWTQKPLLETDDPALQKVFNAAINTLDNCAQETIVDGMARERQQYSGDCGHVLHAVHLLYGESRLPARYLKTFSQGLTQDGYFLDCWPAYDRLARIMERQLELTPWGPILDHGVGFAFDCWFHLLYSGDLDSLREPYSRLIRFADYLLSRVGNDGLLPVENLGTPSVWLDHQAFQKQRHKVCPFNLYTVAMLRGALAPIARAMQDARAAETADNLGSRIHAAVVRQFWSRQYRKFVDNLPWLPEEQNIRTSDRTLATALLFDQCPNNDTSASVRSLVDTPPSMGLSYPANAGWRLWALAKAAQPQAIIKDLQERWAPMASIHLNNTIQEDWTTQPDSSQQWSHCAVAPIYIAIQGLAGIWPLEPGFRRIEIRPQLAQLEKLDLTVQTRQGPIRFLAEGPQSKRNLTLQLPQRSEAEILLHEKEQVILEPAPREAPKGLRRYIIPGGLAVDLKLRYT
ncbi:MAG: alpha-L-rhamnosidase N-terminal domain-containing protein [Limisphaerales bacterium]